MFTCLSPNGGQLTTSTQPVQLLKVATIRGIHTLERDRGGESWRTIGVALPDYQISALLHEPQSGRLFAATHGNCGLWLSEDGGKNWRELTRGLRSRHFYTITVQYRAEHPVLWLGAEPAQLYRSDDLGESFHELSSINDVPDTDKWTFPPPPHVAHVKHVGFHPEQPKTLYVCIEQGALLKTTDDGATWQELHGYEQPDMDIKFRHDAHRTVQLPSDANTIYFCAGEGLYVSRDAGATWLQLQSRFDRIGYPDSMFFDPRNEQIIFMGGAGDAPREWRTTHSSRAGVIRSPDGGNSWSEPRNGLPDPVRGNIEAVAHHHAGSYLALLAGTATGEIYMTENDGAQWNCIASGLPPISKAGHYRWFLSDEDRVAIDQKMYAWKTQASA